ncbi:MAG: hypothetical protein J6K64_04320 [Clostridia bacterium]|nr:hypothetical protein [Clostridia bacterium]
MAFVSLNCPNCAASIELDNSREFGFCQYCGTKIVQDKIVVEHRGSVSIDRSNEIINLLRRAQEMFEKGLYKDSEIYFNRVLDIDTSNSVAREGLDLCHKALYEPNITITRLRSSTRNNFEPLGIYVNGTNVATLKPEQPKTLKLGVGTHYISAYFMNGTKNKPVPITINNVFQRMNITFRAKLFGKVDIEVN